VAECLRDLHQCGDAGQQRQHDKRRIDQTVFHQRPPRTIAAARDSALIATAVNRAFWLIHRQYRANMTVPRFRQLLGCHFGCPSTQADALNSLPCFGLRTCPVPSISNSRKSILCSSSRSRSAAGNVSTTSVSRSRARSVAGYPPASSDDGYVVTGSSHAQSKSGPAASSSDALSAHRKGWPTP